MKSPKHATAPTQFNLKPLAYLIGSVAMASCLAATHANAQDAKSPTVSDDVIEVIDVIGTRQSEQNAIDRKKKAKTALDSIIAEDIGKMPDQNVGEAISRIAGVSLDRGDTGEGVGISIRGQSPDLTRVEVDGQAMLSGGGASSGMNGTLADGAGGRGQGMRDMPADLIKSVDVIKGSTADMTEGSLGGAVHIKTRNALELKKRYSSIKIQGTQGSVNTDLNPAYTIVLADQFMDGRLGIMLNASGSDVTNEGHSVQTSDNGRGYNHNLDFDNSPEKTYSFNPDTLNLEAESGMYAPATSATSPFFSLPTTTGTNWTSESPLSFLQKAAAAQSKAECYTTFPAISAGQLATMTTANQTAARGQRSNELIGCLNQWNDWTPQNMRYIVRRDYEDRQNIDLRADFKVNDDLTVYAKGSKSSRDILNTFETYTPGGNIFVNPTGLFTTTGGVTNAVPNSGFYTNTNNIVWSNANQATGIAGIKNNVTNVIPGTVYVDDTHHVASYNFTNGISTTDQIDSDQKVDIRYLQVGGTFERDQLTAEFMLGDSSSVFSRNDVRVSWSTNFGAGTAKLVPGGIYQITPAEGSTFDQTDAANYVKLNPAANAASPRFTPTIGFNQQQPRLAETSEQTGKLDVTYKFEDEIPFITQVKGGLNYRTTDIAGWANGGGQISVNPTVTLATNNARGGIVACEPTATSTIPCAYGIATEAIQSRNVNNVVTQAELQAMIDASMKPQSATFMNGMKGRSSDLLDGWYQIDVKEFYRLAGASGHFSLDCMKECIASDGNTYKQPMSQSIEDTLAGYVMADFEFKELPYDMELVGNVGVRVVENTTKATGFAGLRSIVKTAAYDPTQPTLAAGIVDTTVLQNVSIEREERNVLPSVNLGLWALPDELVVRYAWAKTLARPNIVQMLPAGTCTYDERKIISESGEDLELDSDMTCGRFGNPSMESYQNTNTNISVEWYPNKGHMLSAAVFNNKSDVGGGIIQGFAGKNVFEGSDAIDPATGQPLSSVSYSGSTWVNGPGYDNTGFEMSAKSSFTFLPWALQYTGIDFNYTKMTSKTSAVGQVKDYNSGDNLEPRGVVPESYNIALWYDDGKLNARLSYQWRDRIFIGQSRGNDNTNGANYPGVGNLNDWVRWTPYNPGAPRFTDETSFIDFKVSYRFDQKFDVFLEARNLGRSPTSVSTGGYYDYSDGTPMVEEYKYFGRKITAGVNYKF